MMKTRIELSNEELKGLILAHFGTQLSRHKPLWVVDLRVYYKEGLVAEITDDPPPPLAETDAGSFERNADGSPVVVPPPPSYSGDGGGSVFDVPPAPIVHPWEDEADLAQPSKARAEMVDAVFDDGIPF